MSDTTFIALAARGLALADDIDDHIDAWHDHAGERPLHEHLGMSHDEYALWVERPEVLRFIVQRHRSGSEGSSLRDLFPVGEAALALAARSQDDVEAEALIAWLQQTGRL